MFTPQRWSGRSVTPRTDGKRSGGTMMNSRSGGRKGNGVSDGEEMTPQLASLEDGRGNSAVGFRGAGNTEAWQGFREAGLLDAAALDRKERETLVEKIKKLEEELFEYQYNMGLLLIEKKEWTSKYDSVGQRLAEVEDSLKREKAAHLNAMSEVDMREESLKKALGIEKQCVADLEKALHDIRAESAEIKFSSDQKSAEADALVASIQQRSLEVEAKLHSADAKLAEANRKCSEMESKLQEIDIRESSLRREKMSLKSERDVQEATLSKQREELRAWEESLRKSQDSLFEDQRLLNQREDKANERDRSLSHKENELDEAKKELGSEKLKLKEKEVDIKNRFIELVAKEAEADSKKRELEAKEQELVVLEKKLQDRERMEIQQIIDEHTAALDSEKQKFEEEMLHKKKALDEENRRRISAVERKEADIKIKEDAIAKREQRLVESAEKLKENERKYEQKMKELKDKDNAVKVEEKGLEMKRKLVETDKQELNNLVGSIEKEKAAVEEEKEKILMKQRELIITEEERTEFLRLQSNLKEEIDHYHQERKMLFKDREELKQEREKFEREWEVLDEKRAEITREVDQIRVEKEKMLKWKKEEEEKLQSKRLETEELIQRDKENLRLKEEEFEGTILLERSTMLDEVQREQDKMHRDFELRSCDFEKSMQNRQEEMEKQLQEKERAFDEKKNRELAHINSLRGQAEREMEEMNFEKQRIERELKEIATDKSLLEQGRLEIQNDINELCRLSKTLKERREEFMKERRQFISVVERHKCCVKCGEPIVFDQQPILEIEDHEVANILPSLEGRLASFEKLKNENSPGAMVSIDATPNSGMSWLQKCKSKIFIFSARKKADDSKQSGADQFPSFDRDLFKRLDAVEDETEPSFGTPSDSVDGQRIHSHAGAQEIDGIPVPESQNDFARAQGDSEATSMSPDNAGDSQNVAHGASKDFQPPLRYSKRRAGKKGRLQSKRSIKQVVADAKVFLGEAFETDVVEQLNSNSGDPGQINERKEDYPSVDGRSRNAGKRRQYSRNSRTSSELDANDSEGRSASVTNESRRKRSKTVAPGLQIPSGKRYNFRRSTVSGTAAAAHILPSETHCLPVTSRENELNKVGTSDAVPPTEPGESPSIGVGENCENTVLPVTMPNVSDGQEEFSSQKFDRITIGEHEPKRGAEERSVDDLHRVEELNGTAEDSEDGYRTEDAGEGPYEDNEDESDRHTASIGKKLWKFFTT